MAMTERRVMISELELRYYVGPETEFLWLKGINPFRDYRRTWLPEHDAWLYIQDAAIPARPRDRTLHGV